MVRALKKKSLENIFGDASQADHNHFAVPEEKTCWRKDLLDSGWQKLRERASGARRKVLTQTKILSPNTRYFVAILRFVAINAFYKALIEL